MKRIRICDWLREDDPRRLEDLWLTADVTRRRHVGDAVHLRGLVEISNICVRQCAYCGLRAGNKRIGRYRLSGEEILDSARRAMEYGYGTLVMQSGEDHGLRAEWVAQVIRRIKSETPLAVTLSLGERDDADLALWRKAGADRYLLRFETSDRALYDRIHPPVAGRRSDRLGLLRRLRVLGYEIGSGVMVGIPGQRWESLAADIELFRALDLDMIGIGPFIPHPETPLGAPQVCDPSDQVPNTELLTYKALALARIACPQANLPSTTALATLNAAEGRELGLQRGANVVMPNLTPPRYRALYEIYPGKACVSETAEDCRRCLRRRIEAIGRRVGTGRGDRVRGPHAEAMATA